MKIASVTFFGKDGLGGARTPSKAFAEWCNSLGHHADIIEINGHDSPDDILKNYDFAFLNTPPTHKVSEDYIKIPFAIMMHAEGDLLKYQSFHKLVSSKFCKVLVHIDYDNDYFESYHNNRIAWHPCCSPRFLSNHRGPQQDHGILYAGRITPWKNSHLLKEYSINKKECDTIYGQISDSKYAEEHKIIPIQYNIDSDEEIFDQGHDLFWSVCGSDDNHMEVKRIDLTAFEAFSYGLMPIVNRDAITDDLKGAFIEVTLPIDFDELEFKIKEYRKDKETYFRNAMSKLYASHAAYDKIKTQVKDIINCFEPFNQSSVSDILRNAADLFEAKNAEYGNAYIDHPKIMHQLFGNIELKTERDYAMLFRVSAIISKLNRYAKNFDKGGHKDSAVDSVVFSAMLQELNKDK